MWGIIFVNRIHMSNAYFAKVEFQHLGSLTLCQKNSISFVAIIGGFEAFKYVEK